MFFIPALFNVIASVAASITTTQALAVVGTSAVVGCACLAADAKNQSNKNYSKANSIRAKVKKDSEDFDKKVKERKVKISEGKKALQKQLLLGQDKIKKILNNNTRKLAKAKLTSFKKGIAYNEFNS